MDPAEIPAIAEFVNCGEPEAAKGGGEDEVDGCTVEPDGSDPNVPEGRGGPEGRPDPANIGFGGLVGFDWEVAVGSGDVVDEVGEVLDELLEREVEEEEVEDDEVEDEEVDDECVDVEWVEDDEDDREVLVEEDELWLVVEELEDDEVVLELVDVDEDDFELEVDDDFEDSVVSVVGRPRLFKLTIGGMLVTTGGWEVMIDGCEVKSSGWEVTNDGSVAETTEAAKVARKEEPRIFDESVGTGRRGFATEVEFRGGGDCDKGNGEGERRERWSSTVSFSTAAITEAGACVADAGRVLDGPCGAAWGFAKARSAIAADKSVEPAGAVGRLCPLEAIWPEIELVDVTCPGTIEADAEARLGRRLEFGNTKEVN
jgi:hypothetical protein